MKCIFVGDLEDDAGFVAEVLQEKGIELIISIHTFLAEGDRKNIYNYFFIMHIFMHYILSYL